MNGVYGLTNADTTFIKCSKCFFYVKSLIWNVVRVLIKIFDFSSFNSSSLKSQIKNEVQKVQMQGDPNNWQHGSWNALQLHKN